MSIRLFAEADVGRLVEIRNQVEPEPITVVRFLDALRRAPDQVNLVAESARGIYGFARLFADPIWGGWTTVHVQVAAESRGAGVGRLLWERLLGQVGSETPLQCYVREGQTTSREWAERRSFAFHALRFQSVLELAGWQPPPARPVVGYEIVPTEDWDRLYQLYAELITQAPDGASAPGREWFGRMFEGRCAALVADAGGQWLGLTLLEETGSHGYNAFTGVRSEHRGRGLALNLKLSAIEQARARGLSKIITNNLSTNAPMLAVNDRLGYRRLPGIWWLRRPLRGGSGRTPTSA